METERFNGNDNIIYVITACVFFLFILGYFERGNVVFELGTLALGIGLIAYAIYDKVNTYLEIQSKRYMLNKGFHEFGSSTVDIYKLKYIYRSQAFKIPSWGSLLNMYYLDDEGKIKHTAIREANYSEATVKSFLKRIKELNPNIEIDEEYTDFMNGKYDGKYFFNNGIVGETAKRSTLEVEAILREKGEEW